MVTIVIKHSEGVLMLSKFRKMGGSSFRQRWNLFRIFWLLNWHFCSCLILLYRKFPLGNMSNWLKITCQTYIFIFSLTFSLQLSYEPSHVPALFLLASLLSIGHFFLGSLGHHNMESWQEVLTYIVHMFRHITFFFCILSISCIWWKVLPSFLYPVPRTAE